MNTLVLASWLRQLVFWISLMVLTIGLIGFSNAETPATSETAKPTPASRWIYVGRDPLRGTFYFDASQAAYLPETRQVRYVLGAFKPGSQAFTLWTNEEDCRINQSRWGFEETAFAGDRPVNRIVRGEDEVPYFQPKRDSIEEAVNHKVCYCVHAPDSIVCQPESQRLKEIDSWATPPSQGKAIRP